MVVAWPKPISLLSQVVIEDDYYKVWAAADQPYLTENMENMVCTHTHQT